MTQIDRLRYLAFQQLFRHPRAVARRTERLQRMSETPAVLTRGNFVASSWEEPPSTVVFEESDSDNGVPDLMDNPQIDNDDQKKARQTLNRTVQPFIRIHNVPTERHFPNRGNLMSLNPPSSISQSANSIIQSINIIQEVLRITSPLNPLSIQPTPQVYWPANGIIPTDLPERIMKRTSTARILLDASIITGQPMLIFLLWIKCVYDSGFENSTHMSFVHTTHMPSTKIPHWN